MHLGCLAALTSSWWPDRPTACPPPTTATRRIQHAPPGPKSERRRVRPPAVRPLAIAEARFACVGRYSTGSQRRRGPRPSAVESYAVRGGGGSARGAPPLSPPHSRSIPRRLLLCALLRRLLHLRIQQVGCRETCAGPPRRVGCGWEHMLDMDGDRSMQCVKMQAQLAACNVVLRLAETASSRRAHPVGWCARVPA